MKTNTIFPAALCLILITATGAVNAQVFVSTFSGTGIAGYANGGPANSMYREPWGMCRDADGSIFLADAENDCIRKIMRDGSSSLVAGSQIAGFLDGPAFTAQFNHPTNLCFDTDSTLLVADFQNQRIRRIANGMVTTIAGSGADGWLDGPDSVAQFNYPRGICVDAVGNIYVTDSWNHRVRRVDAVTHEVTTYAGGGSTIGVQSVGDYVDASDTSARFYVPCGITIDPSGKLYICDTGNHRIRQIDVNRNVTTYAGSGPSLPDLGSFTDGPALSAGFSQPTDIYIQPGGDFLISDTYNNSIRLLDTQGNVSTIAGTGTPGYLDGLGSVAEFNSTRGIVVNAAGDSIFVADRLNHVIRAIALSFTGISSREDENKLLSVIPNPFAENIRLVVSPSAGTPRKISISDVSGNMLREESVGRIAGSYEVAFTQGELAPGFYLVSIQTDRGVYVKRMLKVVE